MNRREMLRIAGGALGACAVPLTPARAAGRKKSKVLYFTRSAGFEHPVVKRAGGRLSHSETALTAMGNFAGFEVTCTKDGTVFDGDLDPYDVIAFYTSGDLTKPNKAGTPPMSPSGKRKLLQAVGAGKGFVGFHSASDTFHSPGPRRQIQKRVDPYIAMLGGEFVEHGAQQEAALFLTNRRFPGVNALGCAESLSFTDEWYAMKNFARDLYVILVQETSLMKGDCYRRPDYPCTWARRHGHGRVFYTSMGHREDIWTNPFFQAIVIGGIAWASGSVDADVEPNIEQFTPKANQLPA